MTKLTSLNNASDIPCKTLITGWLFSSGILFNAKPKRIAKNRIDSSLPSYRATTMFSGTIFFIICRAPLFVSVCSTTAECAIPDISVPTPG
ncbi:hypothetical protein D3C72_1744550 [compost metagenome]